MDGSLDDDGVVNGTDEEEIVYAQSRRHVDALSFIEKYTEQAVTNKAIIELQHAALMPKFRRTYNLLRRKQFAFEEYNEMLQLWDPKTIRCYITDQRFGDIKCPQVKKGKKRNEKIKSNE